MGLSMYHLVLTVMKHFLTARKVYQLIQGRYRASRDKQKLSHGVCAWCFWPVCPQTVMPCKPKPDSVPRSLCCDAVVHPDCKPTADCRACHEQLRVLPCVVCKLPIAWRDHFAKEYKAALPYRTPCCGADVHPECRTNDIHRCPLCSYPLINWELDVH